MMHAEQTVYKARLATSTAYKGSSTEAARCPYPSGSISPYTSRKKPYRPSQPTKARERSWTSRRVNLAFLSPSERHGVWRRS
jgi:hypothetical protein